MLNRILFIFFISIIYSNSDDILSKINSDLNWILTEQIDNKSVYEFFDNDCDCTYLKVETIVKSNEKNILETIIDIVNYNNIISNSYIETNLVEVINDTIFAHQIIKNGVPFVRDRQYVFKMYYSAENCVEWVILDKKDSFLKPFLSDDLRTLATGAGSWSFRYDESDKLLINKIYVNDEVNLPNVFLNKLRKEQVIQIFSDVIEYTAKK